MESPVGDAQSGKTVLKKIAWGSLLLPGFSGILLYIAVPILWILVALKEGGIDYNEVTIVPTMIGLGGAFVFSMAGLTFMVFGFRNKPFKSDLAFGVSMAFLLLALGCVYSVLKATGGL